MKNLPVVAHRNDLYDLTDSPRLRTLTGNFLTLYWAEVAAEFEPRTGQRAIAATRNPFYDGVRSYWAQSLLYCYGWFFTRAGDAYAAIYVAEGYNVTTRTCIWPDRKLQEVEEKQGHHLECKNMWAPVVIQMGRASEYESFKAFQKSVKDNKFEYLDGKLTYISETNQSFEYWTKGIQMPKINGKTVNLNPPKTYDSPFLSMERGSGSTMLLSAQVMSCWASRRKPSRATWLKGAFGSGVVTLIGPLSGEKLVLDFNNAQRSRGGTTDK